VSVFLPQETEGFYLPALEGMALGTVIVCPDVLGNRSFCRPGVNCFRPPYDEDALFEATEAAFADLPNLGEMTERAHRTADEHDLARERESFLRILERVDDLW
jgi:glycosyltransferase involved in cell wall biosynthesis